MFSDRPKSVILMRKCASILIEQDVEGIRHTQYDLLEYWAHMQFLAAKSRWMYFFSAKYSIPLAIWRHMTMSRLRTSLSYEDNSNVYKLRKSFCFMPFNRFTVLKNGSLRFARIKYCIVCDYFLNPPE